MNKFQTTNDKKPTILDRHVRLLFVSHGYPPLDGGVAVSTQRLARNLSSLGCSVLVFTFDYRASITGEDRVTRERDGSVGINRFGPFYRHHDIDEYIMADLRRRTFDLMEREARAYCPTVILSYYAGNAA